MKLQKAEKMKSGVYRIRLRLGGKSIAVYGETEAQCRQNATLIKSEHLSGVVVQKKCDYTTKEALEAYIAAKDKLSPSTIRGYETIKDTRFTSVMDKRIDSVDWQAAIDDEDCSSKTLKNAWGLIKSAMRFVGVEPPSVELPPVIINEHPFLEPDQLGVFLDAIRGSRYELGALLGLHSLRRSEIYDITKADIDLKKGLIHVKGAAVLDKDGNIVHKETNKTAASARYVPIMIPRLKELLEDAEDGYLVTYNLNLLYKNINSICAKSGLPKVGCHGLRHSAVSLAFHLRWDELTSMRIFGYSDFNTMRKIYTHLAQKDKDNNVKAMETFFKDVNTNEKKASA